jgi:hypothetical protein
MFISCFAKTVPPMPVWWNIWSSQLSLRQLKIIAYILSFYILFCAIAPCYLFDNCEETEQYANTKSKPVEDCNSCSPFSTCSSCHGFSFSQTSLEIEPLVFHSEPVFANNSFSSKSGYPNQFFQPPRIV